MKKEDADRDGEELDDERADARADSRRSVSIARDISFGTIRFSPLAAIVSTTMVMISGAYGWSREVSFGPAGPAGGFESGTET